MSDFSAFAIGFCGVCIVMGGLFLLCPTGALEKSVRYVFALLFLSTLLALFPKIGKFRFSMPQSDTATAENALVEAIPEWAVKLALEQAHIKFTKITVCTDNFDSAGIGITKVIIWSEESEQKITEVLKGESGTIQIEVRHE